METISDNRDDTVSRLHDDVVNGPGVASLAELRFAEMWVTEGRHTADDGKQKKRTSLSQQTVYLV